MALLVSRNSIDGDVLTCADVVGGHGLSGGAVRAGRERSLSQDFPVGGDAGRGDLSRVQTPEGDLDGDGVLGVATGLPAVSAELVFGSGCWVVLVTAMVG